jgi:O-antigen ligase
VNIDVMGTKETVSTVVLTPLVYLFGLHFIQVKTKPWEKIIYIGAILSIYATLVITFSRGNLLTILLLSILYIAIFGKKINHALSKTIGLCIILGVAYFLLAETFQKKGYDPLEKLIETAQFAIDVDNPDWDKGRSISREYATKVWENNYWTGAGYKSLYFYGMPETIATAHNFIITSLFHRGIIGTCIYLSILSILFLNCIKLWRLLNGTNDLENDIFKFLILTSFCWFIPFWQQEVIWEKYSLSIQFLYLGIITNIYSQKAASIKQSMTA